MRKLVHCLAIITALSAVFVGCGGQGGGQKGQPETKVALEFKDGSQKYYPVQSTCPVCQGKPIKKDLYADTEQGRIYFDKQECVQKFKDNKAEYLQDFQRRIRSQQAGQEN